MEKAVYHHGDLRDALLKAAEARLAHEHINTLSIRALAKDVGVTPGAPYHHFKDRSALRLALCQRGFDRLAGAMDAEDGFVGKINAYFGFALEHRSLFELMFSREATEKEAAAQLDPHAAPVFARLEQALDSDFPVGPGDHGQSATAVWAFLHGTALLLAASPITQKLAGTNPTEFALDFIARLRTGH